MSNFVNREASVDQADERNEYVSPTVIRLGTPAEICKEVKIQPPADSQNLTFLQSIPAEFVPKS
jgi:hypothetical protein